MKEKVCGCICTVISYKGRVVDVCTKKHIAAKALNLNNYNKNSKYEKNQNKRQQIQYVF